ncbi:MAG: hypothetical protein K8T10_18325 [Candidatus Eremiobacteraeota bacterium]|nr:hypothetical protein [Candidatus Eremiobacteraeota bacterium]
MSRKKQGFLVVLKFPEEQKETLNLRYKGIDRMPCYYLPPVPDEYKSEEEAMDEYVFADKFNDDNGFIPTYENAKILLKKFSKSHREFEIIFCKEAESNENIKLDFNIEELGYDVAGGIAPFWSIVGDFDVNLSNYLPLLNKNGLFDCFADACDFMNKYMEMKLPDYEGGFVVWKVYRLI